MNPQLGRNRKKAEVLGAGRVAGSFEGAGEASGIVGPVDCAKSMYMQLSRMARAPTKSDDGFCALVAQECIANRVRLLNRAVSSMYDEALRPHGLRITQMSILVVVSMLGEATPGDFGRILCLEKSTVSRTLDRLRTRGWIDVLSGADARSTRVRITAKGAARLRAASSAWRRIQRKAQEVLGDDAVHELGKASAAFVEAARPRRG